LSCVNWTCEGLKHKVLYVLKIACKRCELNLWGIETNIALNLFFVFVFVWIEPVRDWNGDCKFIKYLFPVGVNWTCEGLKQCCKWENLRDRWCVNWTCEGLKRLCFGCLGRNKKRVNWTCEGLKLTYDFAFFDLIIGVNWTCEGLKLMSIVWLRIPYIGVNWTCEGLKPPPPK